MTATTDLNTLRDRAMQARLRGDYDAAQRLETQLIDALVAQRMRDIGWGE